MDKKVIFIVLDTGIHVKLNDNYYNFYDSACMHHLAEDYLNYMSTTFTNCEDWECNSNKFKFQEDLNWKDYWSNPSPSKYHLTKKEIEEILKNEDLGDSGLPNNLQDFIRCVKEVNK